MKRLDLKDTPFIFNGIINGKITQIRFPCRHTNLCIMPAIHGKSWKDLALLKAYLQPNDYAALLQSYESIYMDFLEKGLKGNAKQIQDALVNTKGWKQAEKVNSYLMPYYIQITDCDIKRIQDVTTKDCLEMGINSIVSTNTPKYTRYTFTDSDGYLYAADTAMDAYEQLICLMYDIKTWSEDPYTFVYKFRLVEDWAPSHY